MALTDFYEDLFTLNRKIKTVNEDQQSIFSRQEITSFYCAARQDQLTKVELAKYGFDNNGSKTLKVWAPPVVYYQDENGDDQELIIQEDDEMVSLDNVEYNVKAVKLVKRGVEPDHLECLLVPQILSV